jgi:predicted dehydrogenase
MGQMKSTKLRVGVMGLTHDHVWGNLQELTALPGGQLVAVADPHLPLRERAKRNFHCRAYADADRMLGAEKLDAVYLFGDNAGNVAACEAAAANGLHVLVEKPIAATLAGADRMVLATRKAGVRLMVNWPNAWSPALQEALAMATRGDLGELWQVKYRAAHAGPKELGCSPYFCDWLFNREQNGGGALIDYCCYGAALSRLLLGVPSRVTAVARRLCKEEIPVEDNAMLLMTYPRALSLAEGSWTQIGNLSSYVTMIHGTTGTLQVNPDGRLLHATTAQPDGMSVKVPKPAPHMRHASAHFLYCLATGQAFTGLCSDRVGRDAQEILEAGLRAANAGAEVSLPLR